MANEAASLLLGADLAAGLADVERRVGAMAVPGGQDGRPAHDEAAGAQTVQLEDGRWIEVSTYPAELGVGVGVGPRTSRIVVLRDVTPGPRRRGRARGVPGRPVARAADAGDDDLRLRQGPPAPVAARRPGGDAGDIEAEADRLYRIVEDLLALSRVEGGITIDGEPVLVQHLVAPVVASESAALGPGSTFETRLPPDLPAVFGERTYVEQVLRNLISNAGKYGTPGHDRRRSRPRRPTTRSSSASSTAASASRPRRPIDCSSCSTGRRRPRGRRPVPGSACTSAVA